MGFLFVFYTSLTRHAFRSSKVVSPALTRVLVMPSLVRTEKRVSSRYGEETPPTSFVTSPPRLLTLLSVRIFHCIPMLHHSDLFDRGLLQVSLRFQEERRLLEVVRWQCCFWWCSWCLFFTLRLLSGLRPYPSCQRREIFQGWRRSSIQWFG